MLHRATARQVPAAQQHSLLDPQGKGIPGALAFKGVVLACQKYSPGTLVQLQGVMNRGKAGTGRRRWWGQGK